MAGGTGVDVLRDRRGFLQSDRDDQLSGKFLIWNCSGSGGNYSHSVQGI